MGMCLCSCLNYKDEGEEEGFTIEVDSAQFNYPHIFLSNRYMSKYIILL